MLLRQRSRLTDPSRTLWLNPPADDFWQPFAARRALTFDHGAATLLADHLEVSTRPAPLPARHIVLYLPKSKARLKLMLALASACLEPDGQLWLVGAKKAGAPSAGKSLKESFTQVRKLDAARHCMLFEASGPKQSSFDLEPYWQAYPANGLTLYSLPGVFSHGRLDEGSRMLMDHLPLEMPGACLDFGSGCGVLSAVAAARGAETEALDADELAVLSTRRTLEANGLEGTAHGATRIIAGSGPYRWIVSNPPFHQGIATDLSATHQMLDDAAASLSSDGELWLVANRFLDYPKRLAALFAEVSEPGSSPSFRVIRARRPRRRRP